MQSNGQMGCMCVQAIYNHDTSIFAIKELFVVVSNSRFFHRQKLNSAVTTIKTPYTLELHIYGMTLGSCSASLIFVVTLPLGTGIGDSRTCFTSRGFIRTGLLFPAKSNGHSTWRPATSGIVSKDYITLHLSDVSTSCFFYDDLILFLERCVFLESNFRLRRFFH